MAAQSSLLPTPALAEVAVPLPLHQRFTYVVPPALDAQLALGHVVRVPFGPRTLTGYVVDRAPTLEVPVEKLRAVTALVDPLPAFDQDQLGFFRWIAGYYRAGLGEVIATALPSGMRATSHMVFRATDEGVEALAVNAVAGVHAEVLREVIARPGLTRRGLVRRLRELLQNEQVEGALDALRRKELVVGEQDTPGGLGGMQKVVRLIVPAAEVLERLPRAGKRQREVVDAVAEAGGVLALAALAALQGPYARTAARKLVEAGILADELVEVRDPVVAGELPASSEPPVLTAAQEAAVEAIAGEPRPWLLHGVTGSGKTEVYLHAASRVLERDQQVLVLVPEIGLTPLLTGRFRARFGERIAVLHSGLTGAQRLREWRRIRSGEATVAIGARSALFAPFRALGLLVVDEEHDDSYKQDEGVRYSARDLAVVLGHLRGAAVVLGSATPSMETWENARAERYGLLQLLERPTPRPVPTVELVDLNRVARVDGRPPVLAPVVVQALRDCFDGGGKAIVLFNRRGYANSVQCPDCGGGYACPSCGVNLVLHMRQRTLTCHYCGFHRPYSPACPSCTGTLDVLGQGTQRVEEALDRLFPDVPVGRMDADTTQVRGSHHAILEAFRRGETRMLVGTQIVAKGHDFPDVHLAVVVSADHTLHMPDFRAAERTYALLTQVAGRAGRGDVTGRVLVQTHQRDHFVFQHLDDFAAFMDEERRLRQTLRYPPFRRLVLLRVEGAERSDAMREAVRLAKRLRDAAPKDGVMVLGPVPAAMPRLVGRWRFQILLKGQRSRDFQRWLAGVELSVPTRKGVRLVIDVDPRHLM